MIFLEQLPVYRCYTDNTPRGVW